MNEWRRQEDRSSPQQALVFKLLLQKFLSRGSNSIIPYWLWEASHHHIFLYKGVPSPQFLDPQLCYCYVAGLNAHTLGYCYAAGLESNFWMSLNTKAFCEEVLSSSLLLRCIHGFHYHILSMHFHISLDLAFID